METENNSDLEIESSHTDPADNQNPVDTPFPHSISLSPNDLIIEIFQSLENDCYLDPEAYGNYDGDLLNLLFITSLQGKEPEQVKAELEEQNTSFEVVCGRFIKEKEVFFRCLDCDLLKQKNNYVYALLCTHCFEDSDHKGHRILYEQAEAGGSAICDCGDPYSFKEEGFCKKHKDIKIDPQTVLGRFPKELLEDVTTNLRKAFYGIVSVYELAVKFSKGDINQRNHFHHLGRVMFQDLIGFCEMLHTELSSGFLLVLGDVFRSGFLQDFSMVWHDCEDYNNDNNDWSLDHKQPHPCKCTILDNLFRIGAVLDEESQGSVQKLLLECAKDRSFKIHALHRFVKYMPYMYNQDYKNSLGKTMCRLVNMKVQLYGDEELCAEALKSGYFGNHLHILKRAIMGASELSNELYNICMDINMALGYCLVERYPIGPAVVEKLNLIEEIFGVLKIFQNKFPYSKEIRFGVFAHEVDYNSLNFGLMVTRTLTDILENSFAVFFKLEDQQKSHYIQRTLELWRSNFEEAKQVTEENLAKGVVSFNCIFERSFAFLVSYTTKEANRVKFQEFQNRFFPGTNAETLAKRSSEDLIKTFGRIRYLHLIHNFSFGELYSVYYFKNNLYFESDISFIQRICQQLDRKGAYDFLVRNYFNYCPEIVKFLRHPATESIPDDRFREKLLTVEDFLDFLIFIMTDEICYLNVLFGEKDAHYKGEKLSIRGEKIFKKLLISILAGYYWVDGNTVKEDLKQYLFVNEKEFNMNKIYSEIVLVDKKNKKVRVKDELVKKFDPYILYRNPNIQRKKYEEVLQKSKQSGTEVDVVGGQAYEDYPQHLLEIQENILESELMDFVIGFVGRFTANYSHLVRPIMKIITLYLENLQRKESSTWVNNSKIAQTILSSEFLAKLKEIVGSGALKDCEVCLKRIEAMVTRLNKSSAASKMQEEEIDNQSPNKEDEKKLLAEQKRKAVQEQFLKKQKLFQDKMVSELESNKDMITEESKISDQSMQAQKNIPCQYCREMIDTQKEAYGIPALVSLSNNLYKKRDVDDEDVKEKPFFSVFPVISSCFHYYHEKCLKICFHNLKNQNAVLLETLRPSDSLCPGCKQLFNTFIPFTDIVVVEDENPEEEEKKQQQSFYKFDDAIYNVFEDWNTMISAEGAEQSKKEIVKLTQYLNVIFVVLEECYKIQDSAKFTKFVTLYHRVFQIFGQWARTQTFYKDKYPSVLQHFSRVESSSLIDEMVLCEILFDLLTVSNPDINKELSVNQLIIEYFIYKVIRQNALTLPEGEISLQVVKNLTEQDWERGEIQASLTKLTKKMQVVKLLVQESSSKLTETNILDCFDMIHNNDILAFQVKDYVNLCKETIAGDKLSQDIEAIVPKMDILKKIESQEMVKKLVKLPKSFQEYNDIYTQKKCSLCGKFSKHLMTSLCLICGDTICQGTCSDMSTELGNLNAHSIQFHAGSCSFMSIQNPFWVIVSAPDAWISGYKDLYTNFLGESVANKIEDAANLYDMEFGDFQLNQEIESQVTEVVLEDSNRRVMYNSAQKEGYYFNNFEV